MADRFDELKEEIDSLKEMIAYQSTVINKLILIMNLADTDLKNHLHHLDWPLTPDRFYSILSEFTRGFPPMLDPTLHNKRSIIDEIREDLALDDYYRRLESYPKDLDDECYDDQQVTPEYEFDFAE